MKRIWKQGKACLLVFALLAVFLLPSCGEAEPTSSGASGEAQVDWSQDMGGYDFVVGSHWGIVPEKGASAFADRVWKRIEDIQTNNNCTITFKTGVTPQEYLQNMSVAAATGVKYADIIMTNVWWYGGFQSSDYFVPWDDITAVNLTAEKWDKSIINTFKEPDGKLYGINYTSWSNKGPGFNNGIFFNKKLLDEYNQPSPYELEKNGEWTWEKLREICKNMTKDLDGDKQTDIWGMLGIDRTLEYSAIRSNGCLEAEPDEKGLYTIGLQKPEAYKAMEYVRDMVNVDKTVYPGSNLTDFAIFKDGKCAFLSYNASALQWSQYLPEMEDDYGIIWFPFGPDNTERDYYNSAITGDAQLFCITAGAEDPQKAGYIFNLLTEPLDGEEIDSWKETILEEYCRGDEQAYENYLKMCEVAKYDGGPVMGEANFGVLRKAIMGVTRDQAQTPAEALESVAPAINQYMAEYWNMTQGDTATE